MGTIPTRKLPKFLRYDEAENKKVEKKNLFNKRQLGSVINSVSAPNFS